MTRQEQKAAAFRAVHAAEPFVIPNPAVMQALLGCTSEARWLRYADRLGGVVNR